MVDEPGTPAGVTAADPADGAPGPTPLVATTLNLYAVPLVSPFTTQLSAPDVAQVSVPGELVTV